MRCLKAACFSFHSRSSCRARSCPAGPGAEPVAQSSSTCGQLALRAKIAPINSQNNVRSRSGRINATSIHSAVDFFGSLSSFIFLLHASLNRRMNFKLDVDLEPPKAGIESLTIDGIEFALVMLVHETRYEHVHVFSRRVRYNDPASKMRPNDCSRKAMSICKSA